MKKIIVPFDFLTTGESSFKYAKDIAESSNSKVTLLHVAKNEEDKKEADSKLERLLESKAINVASKVIVGNLVDDLAKQSISIDGSLVIMAKQSGGGLQTMFGSTAIKVITDSSIPFLIIKEGQEFSPFKKIALTIDSTAESTHVLRSVVQFCETYGSEVVLVGGDQDDTELKAKVTVNMNKMSTQLKNNNISHEIKLLPRKGFEQNLMEFTQTNNIDLIAATYYKKGSALFSSNFIEHLLENKHGIPVLTIGGHEVPAFKKVFNNMVCPISIEKIDSNISRTTIFICVILMGIFLYTYNPIFAYIVAGDYFIRAVFKPIFSPLRFVAELIVKSLSLKSKPINLAPKVFASRLGMLCAVASVGFYFMDMYLASVIIMGMLMALSFADSVLNFCVGCLLYNYIVFPLYKHKVR